MPAAPLPKNELERIQALIDLCVLDTAAEDEFDALVKAASLICNVPISLISLIDSDRQWFKANIGLPGATETPRDMAFCAHAIHDKGIFEVEDASLDPRFKENPLVTQAPDIRFYAGATLTLSNGANVGTLCVIDRVPGKLNEHQRESLKALAQAAVIGLEKRRDFTIKQNELVELARDLTTSELRFKAISDSSPVGIYTTDADGLCTYTNGRWQSIYGLTLEQSLGVGWKDGLHPDDIEKVFKAWLNNAPKGLEYSSTFRVRHANGNIRQVKSRAKPLKSERGEITGWAGTVEDITDYQCAIDDIIKNEKRTRATYESTPAMMYTISPQGYITNVSNLWLSTMGYTRQEVIGKLAISFFTHEDQVIAKNSLMTIILSSGECQNLPFKMLTKAGDIIDVLISAVLESESDGNPLRAYAVIKDVTLTKAAMRTSESLLATIRTQFITSTADSAGNIIEVNEAFCRISQYTESELIGKNHRIINSGFHPKAFFDDMWKTISHGETWHGEICNRAKDGSYYWVDSVITPFSDSTGKIERYISIRKDITARKAQEEIIKKTQSLLDQTGQMAKVGGWELTLSDNSLYWSDETCRIHGVPLGYKPQIEEAINFYAPEARPIIQNAIEQAIEKHTQWDLELPFIQADGTAIWVRALGTPKYDEFDQLIGFTGALQDITSELSQRKAIESTKERISLAAESGGIGIWEYNLVTGTLIWDEQMYRLYGLTPSNQMAPYDLWAKHLHPEDKEKTEREVQAAISGLVPFDTEFRTIREDGSIHYLRATARVTRDAKGTAVKMVGVNWDVTHLRELAQQLQDQHELLRVTLKSIGDAVITTDANGQVRWLNPVAERMTGWSSQEAKGRLLPQVFNIINGETRLKTENPITTALAQGKVVGLANHTVLISRNGEEYGIEDSAAPIRNEKDELLGAVLVFHDVTEQRRLSGEVSYQAKHDSLTGLVNRSEFETRLRSLLHKTHEERSTHAVMYIDLDQFKIVNDTCGHSVGDQLLQQVSNMLGSSIRTRDLLARLGGDEFGVILEHCTVEQAQRVAENICEKMESYRFIHEDKRFRIGTSIGLVTVDNRWQTISAIIQAADTACYAAKEAGRNRVHIWFDTDQAMRSRHGETQWATRIEEAIDENHFKLFAQRIENLRDAAAGIHAEVLLRMLDSDGKLIPPNAFLPAAERFHLAARVDRWVLRNTIEWLKALDDCSSIDMLCINLSGQSIGDRTFHRQVVDILTEAGPLICQVICLEITETAAVTNMADASLFIEEVNKLGVRVALDDFGAGASSFGYLKNLAVDILKIDGQFIKDLVDDPLDDAAVRCFIDVAKVVNLKTVAEYVDKPEVYARVKELGVDFAQGFLLHEPEPIDIALNFLQLKSKRNKE